jgi:hypothetical protein
VHYTQKYYPSKSSNVNKRLRAERENQRHDGTWRKKIKSLKDLNSMDLEALITFVNSYKPKSRRDQLLLIGAAAIIGLAGLGIYHFYNKPEPKDTFKPEISNFKYNPKIHVQGDTGLQNVNFTATDIDAYNNTVPISNVQVEITKPSGDSVNSTIENLGKDLYRAKFNVSEEGTHRVKAQIKDPSGNVDVRQVNFEVVKDPVEKGFVDFYAEKGYNETILKNLSKEFPRLEDNMFTDLDLRKDLEEIVKLAHNNGTKVIDKNAAGVIANIVYNNPDVDDPEILIADISKTLNALEKYSIIRPEGWFVGNLTKHQGKYVLPVYGKDSLDLGLCVISEDPQINRDFTSRQHHVFCYLLKYNPEIADYDYEIRGAVNSIDKVVQSFTRVASEKEVWRKAVYSEIGRMIKLQDEGKLDLKGLTDEEIGQVLFPYELTRVDIKTGYRYLTSEDR